MALAKEEKVVALFRGRYDSQYVYTNTTKLVFGKNTLIGRCCQYGFAQKNGSHVL